MLFENAMKDAELFESDRNNAIISQTVLLSRDNLSDKRIHEESEAESDISEKDNTEPKTSALDEDEVSSFIAF